ncbi:MAG: SpaH/EbpB family LPXTG-anchored major pilin, partial [Cellulomonadaceae bacterium]|nr:SpaH/EbpB family LPXTG-anchored major pilin [Cellulomonadaceae bacterium]
MKYHRYSRRASKALAVGFVLGLGVLAPTAAASPVYTNPPLVNPGTGTLYITKLYSPTQPTQDNGEPNTTITSTNTPVPGVVFSVQQVLYNGAAIDLTSPDGWAQAAAAQALFGDSAPSGSGYSLQLPATSCTTTATGACNLPLPLGLYYVQETTTPSGVTASAPFYVTLPMTNTAGDGWISDGSGYAVYVYPKNDKVNASKTASAPTTPVAGGQITYTVTSDIPEDVDPVSGQVLVNAYVVTDTLDSRLNLPTAANVVVSITNPGGAPAPVVLTQGTDYSVTLTGSTNTVQVTFLAPGLAKLSAAGQSDLTAGIPHGSGHEVQVTFPGTVNSTLNTQRSTAAGDIPNTANVYPD